MRCNRGPPADLVPPATGARSGLAWGRCISRLLNKQLCRFMDRETDVSFLVLIGRIIFAALFLTSSLGHLTRTKMMAAYAAGKGVPMPWLSTFASGVLILLGGLSLLLGIWADLGALLVALFLFPTAVLMHGFWKETGDARM